jgi:hypothetical protein
MPGTFNPTNPVAVGLSTKADHFHRAFNNGLATYYGETGIVGAAAGDDPYFSTATQLSPGARQLRQTFRGLVFGTHPDADKAAAQVYLRKCDELVFHDGTRIANVANLSADLAAAGAGGLDSGSEGASRQYETYVIRKSSDGTLSLILHRAKDLTSDASFTTTRDASRALRLATSTATDNLAQGIQFATSKPFVFHNVELVRAGAVSGRVWFTLEADAAGSPSGVALATSDKIDASVLSTTAKILRLVFRSPHTVTAATQYHLVMHGDYTRSDTVYVAWRGVAAGGYAGGSAKQFDGASWSAATGVGDFYFNCFTEQNDAALTLPSGYDQYCLIHPAACNNSASNLRPFATKDRLTVPFFDGTTQYSSGSFGNVGNLLIDWSGFLPPRPVMVHVHGSSDTVNSYVACAGVPEGYSYDTNHNSRGGRLAYMSYSVDTIGQVPIGGFVTETQAIYVRGSAPSSNVWLDSWEW